MNGLNPAYVESVIRKAKEGRLTTGQAAKLGVSKQYVNRLKRSYAAKGALAETEKRQQEPKPNPTDRPKYIPGPNHPWRRYVLKAKKC